MIIFPNYTLDRNLIHWEDYMETLTPVENREGLWFKRDDLFQPLGPGGLGGSKCRQIIWYIDRYREGKTHILSGASIQSPQLLMSAIVGAHYGLPSRLVVYSKPSTILTHPSPRISAGFGAVFEYCSGPYNPIIQKKVTNLTKPSSLVVHYGITLDHRIYSKEEVRAFHDIGANQTKNIPDEIETIIMPTGSCNSICSVILGLSRAPKNVKTVVAMEIGPDKREWLWQRLAILGVEREKLPFKVKYLTLHGDFSTYSDKMPETAHGIALHPTYEGKMWRWLKQNDAVPSDGKSLFWIVGGEPDPKAMERFFTHSLEVV